MQFREENPSSSSYPYWFPLELLPVEQEVLRERLSFLTALSEVPTARERKQKANITKHPSVTGGTVKRKLTMTPNEELVEGGPPPYKKQRVFTHTPSELVRICAAYLQAQAALVDKPIQPETVMKQVLVRFEQASSKKLPVTSATPSQARLMPLMGLNIEQPPQYANVAEVNVTPAEKGNANGINPLLNNNTPKEEEGGGRRPVGLPL